MRPRSLFALGVIGTCLLAVPVLAGSAAYAIGEARKWPVGLARQPLQAKAFYATITRRSVGCGLACPEKVDEPAGKLLLPEGDFIDVLRVQLADADRYLPVSRDARSTLTASGWS